MSGNVWEWCYDWYNEDITSETVTDSVGPDSGNYRFLRGGSWGSKAYSGTVSNSAGNGTEPLNRSYIIGFRIVRGM